MLYLIIKLMFFIKNQFKLSAQWYPPPEGLSDVKPSHLSTLRKELPRAAVDFILCHGRGPGYPNGGPQDLGLCAPFDMVSS